MTTWQAPIYCASLSFGNEYRRTDREHTEYPERGWNGADVIADAAPGDTQEAQQYYTFRTIAVHVNGDF
jgi:hypothetical protein